MAKKKLNNRNGNGHTATARAPSAAARLPQEDGATESESRLPILKTYKVFIGGKFPRTESGRYYLLKSAKGEAIANICKCSRKDFRDAVVAARAAQASWASRSAYNRAQILYQIAE